MAWLIGASVGVALAVFLLALLDGYLRGREMARSVEGEDRLH